MATKSYLDEFLDVMKKETVEIVFNEQTVNNIKRSVTEWLTIKHKLDNRLYLRYKELQSGEYKLEEPDNAKVSELRKIFNAYIQHGRKIKNIKELDDVAEHFKKGYELIHRIRELITKRDITYTVLYKSGTDSSGKELLEAHLSLEQILPSFSLSLSASNIAKSSQELTSLTNLRLTNDALKRRMDVLLNDTTSAIKQIQSQLDKPDLWDSLVEYRDEHLAASESKYSVNMGRIYEVYSILRRVDRYKKIDFIGHTPGKKNTEGIADKLLQNAIKNTDPGWQIGDIGLEQLKAVFNSGAGIMSGSTMEEILKKIYNAFIAPNQAEMVEALKQIFTTQRQNFDNEIDAQAEKEAVAAIEESVKNLQLTTWKNNSII